MTTCPNCGAELAPGSKFCGVCGAQIPETIFCPNCGEPNSADSGFCQKCGASLASSTDPGVQTPSGTPAASPAAAAAAPVAAAVKAIKSIPPKGIIIGAAVVAVLVLVAILAAVFGGGGGKNYGLYLKDKEIVYRNYGDKDAVEITSRLTNGESISGYELASSASYLGRFVAFSDDGSRIFYPDRLDGSSGVTLYYRNLKKLKEDPLKIDSGVRQYAVNAAGTQVIYLKDSDGTLYLHDLSEKEKIARDVTSFFITPDCKKVCYVTAENSVYIWTAGKDAVKMASDIASLQYVSEDLSTLYYTKDGSLYKQVEGSDEREKIASDVYNVVNIYDSGEIYYTKSVDTEISLMDYVNDDMAAADANITEPAYPNYLPYPDYPDWWDYDTDEEYDAAYDEYEEEYDRVEAENDRLYEEYEAAYDEYRAKRSRDSLRESLQNSTDIRTNYTLYYYNGTEETVVTEALANQGFSCASDKPVAVIDVYSQSEVSKVKLSEIQDSYEVSNMVSDALYSSSEPYVLVAGGMTALDQPDATSFRFAPDGSAIYFLDDMSDDWEYGELYKLPIAKGQPGSAEVFDSDVSNWNLRVNPDGKLIYFKNADPDTDKGDLYIDGEEVDYDVYPYMITSRDNAVYYYTDWSYDSTCGTLKMFKNGNKTKVADDVHDFQFTKDGNICYLYDYSTNYYTGSLYLYNNGKPEKIDDDVAALIPVYGNHIKGASYYGW